MKKKKRHTKHPPVRHGRARPAVLVQQLFFAEEVDPDLVGTSPVIAHVLASIRSTPVPAEPL